MLDSDVDNWKFIMKPESKYDVIAWLTLSGFMNVVINAACTYVYARVVTAFTLPML